MPLEIAGRQVLDSGVIVMAPGEDSVKYSFRHFLWEIVWEKDNGEQRVIAEDLVPSGVKLRLVNADIIGGATYSVANVGTLDGQPVSFAIFWTSVHGPKGTSRLFAYNMARS